MNVVTMTEVIKQLHEIQTQGKNLEGLISIFENNSKLLDVEFENLDKIKQNITKKRELTQEEIDAFERAQAQFQKSKSDVTNRITRLIALREFVTNEFDAMLQSVTLNI